MHFRNAMKRTNLAGRISSLADTQKVKQKHLWDAHHQFVRVGEGTSVWNINEFPSRQSLPIALACVKQQPYCPRFHGPYREVRILCRWSVQPVLSQAPKLCASSDGGNTPCLSCSTSSSSAHLQKKVILTPK